MNNRRRDWVATPTETKIAWIVATTMAILVVGAFLWPHLESEKSDPETVVKEQPEEKSIEKIIAEVQSAEKHQIKATSKAVSAPEPAPTIQKPVAVTTPKTVPTTPPSVTKQASSKLSAGYYVQTGAFSDRKRAEALVKKLSTNWKTQIKNKSNNLFAVWSGPYASSKEATAAKNSIAMRTKIKGFIVKN